MTVVRAMVLAAGFGNRLRPLTDELAKPATPVGNTPLIHFALRRLAPLQPSRVAVNLHHLPDTVRAALTDAPLAAAIETVFEPTLLGTGGGLRNARALLADAEAIVLLNGDTIAEADLAALLADHLASGALATLSLLEDPRAARYGAVEAGGDGAIVDFAGITGRVGARRGLFAGAHALSPAIFGELPERDAFCIVREAYVPLLARRPGAVRAHFGSGRFFDLGTPADYLAANVALLEGAGPLIDAAATVAPGARIGREVVVGAGARIGPRAWLERCVVWPGAAVDEPLTAGVATRRGMWRAASDVDLPATGG